jgi:hypothetical protein
MLCTYFHVAFENLSKLGINNTPHWHTIIYTHCYKGFVFNFVRLKKWLITKTSNSSKIALIFHKPPKKSNIILITT